MKLSILWKLGAALASVGVLATAGAITFLVHSRVQPLGLAQTSRTSPAPSRSPDDPLTLACRRPAMPGSAGSGISGLWQTQPGSVAGYRAHEKFAELTSPHEAVARTDQLSGWLLVDAASGSVRIQTGCVAVNVATLQSVDELPGFNTSDRDSSARDMLGVRQHPYAIFNVYPSSVALDAASTAVQHVNIAGDLEISGVTKPATFSLDLRLKDNQLSAAGNTSVLVDEFGVQVPQEAGGFVAVDPHMTLEVSLILVKS